MAAIMLLVVMYFLSVILAVDVNYVAGLYGIAISTQAMYWISGGITLVSFMGALVLNELYYKFDEKRERRRRKQIRENIDNLSKTIDE